MKPSFGFMILCICLIISGLTGIVTADSARYDKYISIHMNIDGGKITAKSTEINYGFAPNIFPTQEGFKGVLVAADGSTVKTFVVPDPRVQFGDVVVTSSGTPQIQGVVDRQNSADFVVTLPFDRNVTEFRMYTAADGTLLTSVNLKPQMDTFFAIYPKDPDNPASYGSKATVHANLPQAGTPVSATKPSGQPWGILAIIPGTVLLSITAFAFLRFPRVKSKNVLIVDDDSDIIDVIALMLRRAGYRTRAATTGEECLKELESETPDLILLDIVMKPMDGWETLRKIKKTPVTKSVPVIMLTAQQLLPKDVEEYGICIEDYIVKPVSSKDLTNAITHVFARQQMIREKIAAAREAGIDRNYLYEAARLTRVVDVNKRLWDLLVRTYGPDAGNKSPGSGILLEIKNTEKKIRDLENRLEQIRRDPGSGVEW